MPPGPAAAARVVFSRNSPQVLARDQQPGQLDRRPRRFLCLWPMQSSQVAPCAIAVMAKASSPGRTKTRLTPPLTPQEAAELNTTFLKDIADNIARAGRQTSIATYMAFGPPGSEPFFREHLPAAVGLVEAWLGHFGKCLSATVDTLLVRGHASACVLNADSPTLPTAVLVELAEALAAPGDRAVIGPAEDGGYYVLGLKARHRRLFEDIDWSTERVFDQTLERAREIGLPVQVLPAWYDVDELAGLRRLHGELFRPGLANARLAPNAAVHTRALLLRMLEDSELARRLGEGLAEVG